MIDEDDLRQLIREAADSIPPPGKAPEKLVATLRTPVAPPRPEIGRERLTTALKIAAAAVVLIGLVAGLAALGGGNKQKFNDVGASLDRDVSGAGSNTDDAGGDDAGGTAAGAPTTVAEGGGSSGGGTEPGAPPTDNAKIVKTGSIEIQVRKGGFDAALARINSESVGLGGYVERSETSESSDQPSGSLTVRVPVDSYETLLANIRRLGKVGSVTSKGTDVTAQYTDLEARLRALVATRDRLSAVLAEAANVGDILAVQDRITQVQTQIEQLQGQQQVLADQASMATLAITLGEPGSTVTEPESEDGGGLGQAWDAARRRFGDGVEGLVAWSGPLAIVLIVAALLCGLGRLGWVLVRRFTM